MLLAKPFSKLLGSGDKSVKAVKPTGQNRGAPESHHRPPAEGEDTQPSDVKIAAEKRDTESKLDISDTAGEKVAENSHLCCDKCDGEHTTESCPYFKKERENHPDARKRKSKIGGVSSLPGEHFSSARIIRQPGDGSCLFHSLCFGLKDGTTAAALRTKIAKFIRDNPDYEISGMVSPGVHVSYDNVVICFRDAIIRLGEMGHEYDS